MPQAQAANKDMIVVSCYTRFDNLAHGPKGTQAKYSLYTYALNPTNGTLLLQSVSKEVVMNPAFSALLPEKNVIYTCTESVAEDGQLISWNACPHTGKLTKLGSVGAGGTSTCYMFLDKEKKNMLVVNYWNATIAVFGIDQHTGAVAACRSVYDPNEGRPMKARADKHVNHSLNDESTQKERQADPHSHAVILDPFFGKIAFVPDLGMDIIRQFHYDSEAGTLTPAGSVKSGPADGRSHGPRYIQFHTTLPLAYVINELSCEVTVFEFDRAAAEEVIAGTTGAEAKQTLKMVQSISTLPEGWPANMNTCGRICVHPSGKFVLVSNRGHNSITVFRVELEGAQPGHLSLAHIEHTRGATPRHFGFDSSAQWLIAANQCSDKLNVFRMDLATGQLDYTGNEYQVPSPNFVCCLGSH